MFCGRTHVLASVRKTITVIANFTLHNLCSPFLSESTIVLNSTLFRVGESWSSESVLVRLLLLKFVVILLSECTKIRFEIAQSV